MKSQRNFIKNTDGVAATEFAFIAPLLIVMIIGIFDIGMYISQKNKLENLAKSSAIYVSLGGLPANVETDLIDVVELSDSALSNITVASNLVCSCADGVTVDCADDAICGEDDYMRTYIDIGLSHEFQAVTPLVTSISNTTTEASARMRVN